MGSGSWLKSSAGSSCNGSRMRILLLVLVVCVANWAQGIDSSRKSSHSVIVVGAGMSGIMAAKTLSDNGVRDFLILEGTDRIGGRMREESFAGLNVELGANWVEGVHGAAVNPIWNLAQKYQLRTFYANQTNITSNIYDENGIMTASLVNASYAVSSATTEFANNLAKWKREKGEQDVSILTAQRLFGHVPATPLEMLLDYKAYDAEFAEPPRSTSLKNTQPNPTFVDFGEASYFVADPRGYSYILRRLAEEFLDSKLDSLQDARLQLNKVVRKIHRLHNGVEVSTEEGSVYSAKCVILTVSLGVLQSKLIEFHPDLPDWKIEALYEFDMAIFTKIFLKFPYRFWPNRTDTEYFSYADERRGYYPQWQHFENEYPGSNVIFGTVTDDESRRLEQQPDDQTKAEMMSVLKKMFGEGIPEAEQILVPRWWSSRLFGGTYSNWPIGVDEYEFQRIKAPVNPLYFAGEHTSLKYNGYLHGAYFSGVETAMEVIECMRHARCSTDPPPPKPCIMPLSLGCDVTM